MKKRLMFGLAVGALMAAMLPGMASAKIDPKAACKKGGWMDLVKANGQPFTGQDDCVSYVANGGTARPPQTILAIAWTNVDGSPGYDPATDRLIAKLVDTNRSGAPDAGDTVTTHAFPLDFTTTGPVAHATVTSFTVTFVTLNANLLDVITGTIEHFRWRDRNHPRGEYYREEVNVAPFQRWIGLEDGEFNNSLYMNGASPSATGVSEQIPASEPNGDDPFLDVRIS